jgi:hypothetical protein
MRRLGRLTPCWFHGPAAPPQQRHATQSPSLLRPLAPAIGAPLATYPALGTGQTGRWMRCSGRSASIWLAAMRSMSTRQVPSRSHNLSATAATGAAATTRSISSPLSTSPWARPVIDGVAAPPPLTAATARGSTVNRPPDPRATRPTARTRRSGTPHIGTDLPACSRRTPATCIATGNTGLARRGRSAPTRFTAAREARIQRAPRNTPGAARE